METIFYDGHCGLCHGWVLFVLAREPGRDYHFRFAPLQSDAFDKALIELDVERSSLPDSIIVCTADGELLQKSSAVLHILKKLGGFWRFLAFIGWLCPRFLRDFIYDLVARVRYKLFGQPEESCPIIPPELRERFDL